MDQEPGKYGGSGQVRESRKLYNKLKKPPFLADFCKKIIEDPPCPHIAYVIQYHHQLTKFTVNYCKFSIKNIRHLLGEKI